eukprot:gnl/MRDRNA2_/MRDRNA2_91966_c0_seq1.p1 gnl/MRDRNA2_/MRDRNA2_91966_c0~~gnl/MRDRNA2_/MRDRNA2_91966_c0_seq1.p1  ORF type:complete len:105 (-),score=35.46 gnl/MRDRNA2_/MRDRNA2_91966_c0_seq1:387-701(-)
MIFGAAAIGYLPVAYAGGIGALAAASDALGNYFSDEKTRSVQLDEDALKQLPDESGYRSAESTTASVTSELRSNSSIEDLVAMAEAQEQTKKVVTFAGDLEESF